MTGSRQGHSRPAVPEDLVIVGHVAGLFGVRGWVKVYSHTRPREAILGYTPWLIKQQDRWQERALLEGRPQGKGLVAHLADCTDRDQANDLIGADIAVRMEQLPVLKEGEYYWAQLEGLKVVNSAGQELGTVSHLFETGGANDVMVVRGRRERLVPFIPGVILNVDLEAGVIRVDWEPEDGA